MIMPSRTRTYRSGEWIVVECHQGVDLAMASLLRNVAESQRDTGWSGVILDLGDIATLDGNGQKILANFHQTLRQMGRTLGMVVKDPFLRESLRGAENYQLLADLSGLKRSIHEMSSDRQELLETLGVPGGNLLSFTLRCPLCHCETVKGWMPIPKVHRLEWFPNEITPQMVWEKGREDMLDVETYRAAVCPECLFAASRLDWFDLPLHGLRTTLHDSALDRLVKNSMRRRLMLSGERIDDDTSLSTFFGMPRLRQAAGLAWALSADVLQVVGKESSSIDSLGIGVSHIMRARFASDGEDLERHFTAAYIWLKTALEHPESYAEERMAEASVYLVSACLAIGRDDEARSVQATAHNSWDGRSEMDFWLERGDALLQ